MASLLRAMRTVSRSTLRSRALPLLQSVRNYGAPPDDGRDGIWGPYPGAPEIMPPGPEWVELPWPDDGIDYGDYPNYVEWSYQTRDPHPAIPYYDNFDRRYYGEPLHYNDDILSVWWMDDHNAHGKTSKEMGIYYIKFFGSIIGFILLCEYVISPNVYVAAEPKSYPYNNLYLERGGDPDKEPTEEEAEKQHLLVLNPYNPDTFMPQFKH